MLLIEVLGEVVVPRVALCRLLLKVVNYILTLQSVSSCGSLHFVYMLFYRPRSAKKAILSVPLHS
jgi:hypothetical protein